MRATFSVLVTALVLAAVGAHHGSAAATSPRERAGLAQTITPTGVVADDGAQATDAQGDTAYFFTLGTQPATTFDLRIRRADGTLLPVAEVAPLPTDARARMRVAVDRRGNGLVAWEQVPIGSDEHPRVMGRPFTSDGALGPLVRVTPVDHWAAGVEVAVQPGGTALVTWTRVIDNGYEPWMRLVRPDGSLGTPRRVGDGPDAGAPLIAMDARGRATLVWSTTHLYARHVSPLGRLQRTVRVRKAPSHDLRFVPHAIGIDGDGRIVGVGTRWTRNTATYPDDDNSRELTGWFRIDEHLRLMEPVRLIAPRTETIDHVEVAVARSGDAVVGWQRNYVAGSFVRHVRPDGSIGRARRVADGGLLDVALGADGDGVVVSTGPGADGHVSEVWSTPVTNGRFGTSRRVGVSDWDVTYADAAIVGPRRGLVTWAESLGDARILSAEVRTP